MPQISPMASNLKAMRKTCGHQSVKPRYAEGRVFSRFCDAKFSVSKESPRSWPPRARCSKIEEGARGKGEKKNEIGQGDEARSNYFNRTSSPRQPAIKRLSSTGQIARFSTRFYFNRCLMWLVARVWLISEPGRVDSVWLGVRWT